MSSEQDRMRELAERVARRLSNEPAGGSRAAGDELASLRASLAEIRRRLDDIESQTSREHDGAAARQSGIGEKRAPASPAQDSAPPAQTPTRSMWLSGTYMPATE